MDYLVVRMPTEYESKTGFVYMNQEDMSSEFVLIGEFIYKCLPHSAVNRRTIAMNWIQRKQAEKLHINVLPWTPPFGNIDILDINIDVDWIVRDPTKEIPSVAGPFKTHYKDHVLSPGQQVLLYVGDNIALCKVKMNRYGMMKNSTRLNIFVPGQTY
jgi:hypothetical protein